MVSNLRNGEPFAGDRREKVAVRVFSPWNATPSFVRPPSTAWDGGGGRFCRGRRRERWRREEEDPWPVLLLCTGEREGTCAAGAFRSHEDAGTYAGSDGGGRGVWRRRWSRLGPAAARGAEFWCCSGCCFVEGEEAHSSSSRQMEHEREGC